MRRLLFLVVLTLLLSSNAWAKHEKGGYISYQYIGPASGDSTQSVYKITVTMFYSTIKTGPYNVLLDIYDAKTGDITYTTSPSITSRQTIAKTAYSPCLSTHPSVNYLVDAYSETVTLPNSAKGYIVGVTSSGHRTDSINNIYDAGCGDCGKKTQNCYSSCATGLAMSVQIPGIINGVDYHTNNSPIFLFKDTVVICHNQYFEYRFEGIDSLDHDSLSYSFGAGQDGANTATPPFPAVTYASGYSSNAPMGSGVTINPATGLISGIAPDTTGEFIIDVYAKEWRNGVVIDSIKKELQISVNFCNLLSANLEKVYVNCDSLTLSFKNESYSPITQYLWNFGDNTTSTSPTVTHKYSQAGDYTLTLYVANDNGCDNTATAKVKVYPGFKPSFKTVGSCYLSPITFIDNTYAQYGKVNSWEWNFGDPTSASNTANTDTAYHQYSKPQTATVIMQVASSVGCSGSDTMQVVVNDKPYIFLPFTDTLICTNDTLPLIAQTTATTYSWYPQTNMLDSTMLTPRVFPKDTTTYTITAIQGSCVGSASIKVNTLPFITVAFNPDTMHVCLTDSITLSPISHALSYKWTENDGIKTLGSYNVKHPKASPLSKITTYHVQANLGHCPADADVTVYASPYPTVNIISPDTTICYGGTALLMAIKTGAYATWLPTDGLSNATITSPSASPASTTTYTLTVTDTFYCPKPVSESVVVNVVPSFSVSAGIDTAVILGEPLALNTFVTDTTFKYPVTYRWSPIKYIDYPDSPNVIITGYPPAKDTFVYIITATTAMGCVGKGYDTIRFFNTLPDIFVPTGFAPNGNVSKNIVLIPTPVGIARFLYFRVYDRYGHLVYGTNQVGQGWDGTINGTPADAGTYVYVAQGIDYLHNNITRRGTTVLIR
jgi:gliding motility-associated-like protein